MVTHCGRQRAPNLGGGRKGCLIHRRISQRAMPLGATRQPDNPEH